MTVVKIIDVWMVENPCAFYEKDSESTYHFVVKTRLGYFSTRGMLKSEIPNMLSVISREMERGMWIDGYINPDWEEESASLDSKRYPHLIPTRITDTIDSVRAMWELVE